MRQVLRVLLTLLLLVGVSVVWAGAPVLTDAEDETFWDNGGGNGESVVIDGTDFTTASRIYISADTTLNAADILQTEYALESATRMTFKVNKGLLPMGRMYLFVTDDPDLADGVDAGLTSSPLAIGVGRQWSPSDVTTTVWYDAADAATITENGGKVSQWADKSGNLNHMVQTVIEKQLSTGSGTLNGLNVLSNDGSGYMISGSALDLAHGHTVIGVFDPQCLTTLEHMFAIQGWWELLANNIDFNGRIKIGGDNPNKSLENGPHPGPSVYALAFDYSGSGLYKGWVDGTQRAAQLYVNPVLDNKLVLMANRDSAPKEEMAGLMGEVLVLNSVDVSTRQKLEGYLADKWGLQANLPTDHKYTLGGYVIFDGAPTITDAGDEVHFHGETVTVNGLDFESGARVFLSADTILDVNDVMQSTTFVSQSELNFVVDRGAVPYGTVYLIVTNDTDLNDGIDLCKTSYAYAIELGEMLDAGTGAGLRGEYYSGLIEPVLGATQVDPVIDFDWGYGTIHSAVGSDKVIIRWSGQLEARTTEDYTLYLTGDDGVRLWIDGELIINGWVDQGARTYTAGKGLVAGNRHDITVEYYENTGNTKVKLEWESALQARQVIPATQLYDTHVCDGSEVQIQTGTESATSPAWVEGARGPDATNVQVTVDGGAAFSAVLLAKEGFYASDSQNGVPGIELDPAAPTSVTVNGGGQNDTKAITWTKTVLNGAAAVTIRQGDSLLLTAGTAGTGTALTIDGDGDGTVDITGAPGDAAAFQYSTAGTYTSVAKVDGVQVGTLTVTVVGVSLPQPFVQLMNSVGLATLPVTVTPASASNQVTVTSGDVYCLSIPINGYTETGFNMTPKPVANVTEGSQGPSDIDPRRVLTRLGGRNGPLLSEKTLQPVQIIYNDVVEFGRPTLLEYKDGDYLIGGSFRMEPMVADVTLEMEIFTGGNTFLDGSRKMIVNTSDFDENDSYNFYMTGPTIDIKTCHRVKLVP